MRTRARRHKEETLEIQTVPQAPEPTVDEMPLLGIDHVELYVGNASQAAYFFTRDSGGASRCYGDCAVAWPPFYARGKPRAGHGIKRSLLGTVRRRGGRRQVTYAGRPLYFYEHDPRGEVLCNDITEFGGAWFAVTAVGKAPA